jgi:hypothetical protein
MRGARLFRRQRGMHWTCSIRHGTGHRHQPGNDRHHHDKSHGQHRQPRYVSMGSVYAKHRKSMRRRNEFAFLGILYERSAFYTKKGRQAVRRRYPEHTNRQFCESLKMLAISSIRQLANTDPWLPSVR